MLSSGDCARVERARRAGTLVDAVMGRGGALVAVDPGSGVVLSLDDTGAAAGRAAGDVLKRRDRLSLRHCLAHNLDAAWLTSWQEVWEGQAVGAATAADAADARPATSTAAQPSAGEIRQRALAAAEARAATAASQQQSTPRGDGGAATSGLGQPPAGHGPPR
eukprot:COSAG01_NODE_2602_length_7394_cov_2.281563_7_plen_163_part_00